MSALTAAVLFWAVVLLPTRAGAQTVEATGNLAFGSFLAGSGGTVTVSAAGARNAGGTVILVAQGVGVGPAQFTVHGTNNAIYSISVVDSAITLSDGAGHSMSVNSFVTNPSGTGILSGAGAQTVSVGATLNVGLNQPAGNYSGSFGISVNYQ